MRALGVDPGAEVGLRTALTYGEPGRPTWVHELPPGASVRLILDDGAYVAEVRDCAQPYKLRRDGSREPLNV